MLAGPPNLKKSSEFIYLFILVPKFFLIHFKYCGPAELGMYQEYLDFEWWLIDVIYKSLVSFRYPGVDWLNILIPEFGWLQRFFHLSIKVFGGLARCNAHFIPGICIEVPSALTHRWGPQ
jgi:hypothetical protein